MSFTLLSYQSLEAVFHSPSGRTVVYVMGDHWLDSFYSVYVSDGGLFPKWEVAPNGSGDVFYRDAVVGWDGDIFSIKIGADPLRYSETDRAFLQPPLPQLR